MGNKISINVKKRELFGKKVVKLRREGQVPCVVYGPGMDPVAVQADSGELLKVINEAGKRAPINLSGALRRIAMIKDIDRDAAKPSQINHVSFHAVKADEPVVAAVPITLTNTGESEAEKAGLIVLQAIDKVEVKALPMDLPEALEVSVMSLNETGDKLTLGDITLPEGVEFAQQDEEQPETEEGAEDEQTPSYTDLVIASAYEPGALAAANESAAGDAEEETLAEEGEESDSDSDSENTEEKSE